MDVRVTLLQWTLIDIFDPCGPLGASLHTSLPGRLTGPVKQDQQLQVLATLAYWARTTIRGARVTPL